MKRREFLRAAGLGAAAGAAACSPEARRLPLLVRDPNLVLGQEEWKPSLCRECPAGCGVMVRVVSPGRAVKLEGNPRHPVSRGALCARGLTALEGLHHPDRVTRPLRRTGPRGQGGLGPSGAGEAVAAIAAALAPLVARNPAGLAVLVGSLTATDRALLDAFLAVLGAPPAIAVEPLAGAGWREAVRRMTGHDRLPAVDWSRAGLVLAFGVELAGVGPSPVAGAAGIRRLRERERPGRLVAVSSRFTLTAAEADEWVACEPGSEGLVALGIAHALVREGLVDGAEVAARTRGFDVHADALGEQRPGFAQLLRQYPLDKVEALSGVAPETVERLAREAAARRPVAAIGGGDAAAHTTALGSMMAVLALDGLLDGFDGGLVVPPRPPFAPLAGAKAPAGECLSTFAGRLAEGRPHPVEAVWLAGGANPVHALPELERMLASVPHLFASGSLLDDSSQLADWFLPEAHPLERWSDGEPDPAAEVPAAAIAGPAVTARGEARPFGDWLLAVARAMGGAVAAALPFDGAEAALRARWAPIAAGPALDELAATGVWVGAPAAAGFATPSGRFDFSPPAPEAGVAGGQQVMGGMETVSSETLPHHRPPRWSGDEREFPLVLQIFSTPALAPGEGVARPGLGELRDPLTGAMWEAWAEMSPATAAAQGLADGSEVEIATPHGRERFRLRLVPWARPGAIAVVAGAGHKGMGRFGRRRGGNALALASRHRVEGAHERAWASTRARVARVEPA